VITDLMMPVMDGHSLIAAVLHIVPGLPVIATSGLQANAEVAKAANAGIRHFLAKPFSADALLKQVRMILDANDASPPAREAGPGDRTGV
jgi:CheY-like chemotaxis protein